ncbi:sigma 54-interacting transcriptional regulator [bacterium]|nr:sigma 54-interacting transcriptional regulator [bacterium]
MPEKRPNRNIDKDILFEIVQGTASATGVEFFDQLVKHLAQALGTKCAWVTEWLPEEHRLRALSFWLDDGYCEDYEYDIAGTPCEPVIDRREMVHIPDRLIELFPSDPDLEPLGAVSYLGKVLEDTDGRILGHLAVLHDKPLPSGSDMESIFNIFAGRAAAELRRLRRDAVLRERERKLTLLVDSAMDAIVELDADLTITRLNSAAEKTFGCAAANVVGTIFDVFLTKAARGKLAYLKARLAEADPDQRSMWIPEGFEAVRAGGARFPAEGALSLYELDGRHFYTLILRDIDERLAAEARIRALVSEADYLRAEIDALHGFDGIVGESPALRAVLADVDRVAGCDTTVLITGETGTGKELIARALHQRSPRAGRPLIKVNCAAIPASLQESEFFGHEKGAFTGATQRREGRFKLADGGTIFLDEVGELPLDLQAKLLRVLQEGEYEPVGGSRTVKVDVRVVAATNRDLEAMVEKGRFRRDLLYRLNVFPLHVPPLRDRGEDVVLLAESFARIIAGRDGRPVPPLTPDCRYRLKRYSWPGNVRELQNVVERAIITSEDGRRLNLDRALPSDPEPPTVTSPVPEPDRVLTDAEFRDLERANIARALEASGGKIAGKGGAAELLGLKPNTLASRIKALGVERPGGA